MKITMQITEIPIHIVQRQWVGGWTDGREWKQSEADQEKLFLVIKDKQEEEDGIHGVPLRVGA